MSGTFTAQAGIEPGWALLRVAGRADLAVRRSMVLRVPDLSNKSFPPVPVEAEGTDLLMRLGPEITDHLETDTPYTLVLPDAGLTGNVVWPRIVPPRAGAKRVIALPGNKMPVRPPVGQTDMHGSLPGGTTSTVVGGERNPIVPVQPGPGKPRWVMPAVFGGFTLAAVLLGAWWLFLRSPFPVQQSSSASLLPTVGPQHPVAGQTGPGASDHPISPGAVPAASPSSAGVPPIASPASEVGGALAGLSVREVIARAESTLAIDREGGRRLQAGQPDDGVLLLEAAAGKGESGAMAQLAKLYDPNGFDPKGPIPSPDVREAARYYRDAAQAGDKDVDAPRALLHERLQGEAQKGSMSAELALRDFWP